MHAEHLSDDEFLNIDYKARGHARPVVWSRTKNHNLAVAVSHTGRQYSVHAGYYNNHIEQQENGGVVGSGPLRIRRSRCLPGGVPMRLAKRRARNLYRNNAFFVTAVLRHSAATRLTESDFSMANLSAVYIGHSFESTVRGAGLHRRGTSLIRMNRTTGTRTAISSREGALLR